MLEKASSLYDLSVSTDSSSLWKQMLQLQPLVFRAPHYRALLCLPASEF